MGIKYNWELGFIINETPDKYWLCPDCDNHQDHFHEEEKYCNKCNNKMIENYE